MSKDLCPKCGKLVWVTQQYMIADGQVYHIVCDSHIPEQRNSIVIEDSAAPLPNERTEGS